MLVINNEKHTIHIGSIILLPGSNVVNDGAIDFKHPIISALVDEGKLTYETNVTASVATIAVAKANSHDVVEKIEKSVKKATPALKKAAAARRKELDDFDEEWNKSLAKSKQEKAAAEAEKV